MNRNEISELRRRLNPEKNNIPEILGCYVDTKGEIISAFRRPLISMPQEECEKYLNIFRKTLSGTPGKNLIDVEFDPYDVMNSENHKALMHLRETGLKDEEAVQDLFARIISSLKMETNYLILLLCDSYDVPFKGRDDVKVDDASEEVFQYILCAICPVKPTKPALSYFASENEFHQREEDWVVAAPDVGFLFPAFDDRASNIYKTVFYARDAETRHEELTDELFAAPMPRPAMEQLAAFQSVLENALEEDLTYEVAQTVNEQLREMADQGKQDKEAETPTVTKRDVAFILENCGVDSRRLEAFEENYDQEFGQTAEMPVANLIDRKFQVKTPDVVINVSPEKSDLIQTRVIDGLKYILIPADEGVSVNGVNIKINS